LLLIGRGSGSIKLSASADILRSDGFCTASFTELLLQIVFASSMLSSEEAGCDGWRRRFALYGIGEYMAGAGRCREELLDLISLVRLISSGMVGVLLL
jgi:hypothetical protein